MTYKFRGKVIGSDQWVYGNLLQRVDSIGLLSLIEVQDKETFEIETFQVKPESVGMWTGMKDKNGKEIYNGDLIRFAEEYLYIVKYEYAKFVGYHANNDWGKWGDLYKLAEPEFSIYGYFVIGNLHDNPELVNPAVKDSVINTMNNIDPNTPQATEGHAEEVNDQVAGQDVQATEQEAQEKAMESEEEGGSEG